MHENLFQLFIEAEVYLNYFTDIEYAFQANIVRNQPDSSYIEFILCTRCDQLKFFYNERDREKSHCHYFRNHRDQKCSRCQSPINYSDLHNASIEDIEKQF